MRRRWLWTLALGVLLSPADGPAAAGDEVPATAEAPRARTEAQMLSAVFLPRFRTAEGRLSIGTAFLVNVDGQGLLVTAHHLFGVSGGLEREFGWDELAGMIKKVEAFSLASGELEVTTKSVLPIEGAEGFTPERIDGDLAAFRVDSSRMAPLGMADAVPASGARVFVLARDAKDGRKVHAARVIETPEQGLVYMFDNPLSLGGTSGAPVVDENGWVVGLHLAGGYQQGQAIGIANPVTMFRPHLQQALDQGSD